MAQPFLFRTTQVASPSTQLGGVSNLGNPANTVPLSGTRWGMAVDDLVNSEPAYVSKVLSYDTGFYQNGDPFYLGSTSTAYTAAVSAPITATLTADGTVTRNALSTTAITSAISAVVLLDMELFLN